MNKLQALRQQLEDHQLDGYLIPMSDAFGSEYLPEEARRLQYVTGFTGSAGFAIVLKDKAAFFTDGRYTIQARNQVSTADFQLYNSGEMSPDKWCSQHLKSGKIIGFDPWLFTDNQLLKYYQSGQEIGFEIVPIEENLVDNIWQDKPHPAPNKIFIHNIKYAGQSSDIKIENIVDNIKNNKVDAVLITSAESVNWLLNIRGYDLPLTPVALSYAVVENSGKVTLFIDQQKVNNDSKKALEDKVSILPIEEVSTYLKTLAGKWVQIDPNNCPHAIVNLLHEAGADVLNNDDPCILARACKNEVEVQGMRNAHIRDGAALVKFFCWLEGQSGLSEIDASDKLAEIRAQGDLFHSLSFDTISGFGSNGAIVHYKATPDSTKTITQGMYLLDSGAQYLDGTTDVTRTIYIGENPSEQMRRHYTLVLKGHIALAQAKFLRGTTGSELDPLARQFLQEHGLDYDHGTGHGVGSFLNVHEGPQRISKIANKVALREGMIISNEPGVYIEGQYGIRIENLVLVVPSEDNLLAFETLTLVPLAINLIETDLLNKDEMDWINMYHAKVLEKLSPLLNKTEQEWLKKNISF